jgi:hypothetical protein
MYNWGLKNGRMQHVVIEDMVLAQAVRPIARQVFIGVLDAVRTRVLDLALELEQVAPDAGQAVALPADQGRAAEHVINTYNFYGDATNLAIGSAHVTQMVGFPQKGDESGLLRYLAAIGVTPEELVNLKQALAADRNDAGGGNPPQAGSRVRDWIARVGTSAAGGTASGLIIEALKAFFGG